MQLRFVNYVALPMHKVILSPYHQCHKHNHHIDVTLPRCASMIKEIGKLRGEKGDLEDSILALQKKKYDISDFCFHLWSSEFT